MHTKIASIDHVKTILRPLYNNGNKSPTTLLELSPSQYKRISNNSIHLTGLSIQASSWEKNIYILYTHAKYGSNIKSRTKWVDIGDNKWYKLLELRTKIQLLHHHSQ